MKIALASWKGRIAPVFDVSQTILVMETSGRRILSRQEMMLPEDDLIARIAILARLEIDTLICGAVSRPLAGMVTAQGIRLISFVAGNVDEVIEAYLDDTLPHPAFAMPGCRGRQRRMLQGQPAQEWLRHNNREPQTQRRYTMPRGDGTGPSGQGPGTGRGQGPCGTGKCGRGQGGGKGRNTGGGFFGGGKGQGQGSGTENSNR